MGASVGFICEDCGKTHEYLIGKGFMDMNPIELFKDRNDNSSKIITGIIKDLEVRKESYTLNTSLQVYLCSNCSTLESHRHIYIESKDDVYVHNYLCSKCDTKLNKIDLGVEIDKRERIKCQGCGSFNITRSYMEMLWD